MNLKIYNKILQYLNVESNQEKEIIKSLSKEDRIISDKVLDRIENIVLSDEPDYEKMWENIHKNTTNSFLNYFKIGLRYAAALITAAGISCLSYFMYQSFTTGHKVAKNTVVYHHSDKPTLILSDGKYVELTKQSTGIVKTNEKITIKNDLGGVLSYEQNKDTLTEVKYNTIIVPRGAEYSLKLSDGTAIKLNSESKLVYPITFDGKKRVVSLEGEGYFKVSKDKHCPFIVKVHDVDVKVLGTTFNINAYKENHKIATTLVEGSVKVSTNSEDLILKPNHQASVTNGQISCEKVNVDKYISWVHGIFKFNRCSMENLMTQIERWYDVNVFFVNESAKDNLFHGEIKKYEPIENIIKMIEKVSDVKIRIKDKNLFIKN